MTVSLLRVVAYTAKDTVIYDGMSIDFIGTYKKRKNPKSLSGLGF